MKFRLPDRWIAYGGSLGLLLGALVILGFLTFAHIGPGREAGVDPDEAVAQQLASSAEAPKGEATAGPPSGAKEPPFPSTTWGLIERVAAAQLAMGEEEESFRTLALIPREAEAGSPAYRTGRDKAYNLLLTRLLDPRTPVSKGVAQAHPGAKGLEWLGDAEKIAGLMGEGLPRAGAWLKVFTRLRADKGPEAARKYLDRAVAEVRRPAAVDGSSARLREAWHRVGGSLMFFWPIGLTLIGSLFAEIGRSLSEGLSDGLGSSLARLLGAERMAGSIRHILPHAEAGPEGGGEAGG